MTHSAYPRKRDQQVRLHAPLKLMEDGADGELAFQGAERGLRLGQLDVLRPQLLDRLALKIGPEQIGALASVAQARRSSISRQRSRRWPSSARTAISYKSATLA